MYVAIPDTSCGFVRAGAQSAGVGAPARSDFEDLYITREQQKLHRIFRKTLGLLAFVLFVRYLKSERTGASTTTVCAPAHSDQGPRTLLSGFHLGRDVELLITIALYR